MQKGSAERGRVLLGILINQRNTMEKYEKELRRFLLTSTDWASVELAEKEVRFWGATQDDINEAKKRVHNSISDEELIKAVLC